MNGYYILIERTAVIAELERVDWSTLPEADVGDVKTPRNLSSNKCVDRRGGRGGRGTGIALVPHTRLSLARVTFISHFPLSPPLCKPPFLPLVFDCLFAIVVLDSLCEGTTRDGDVYSSRLS